MSAKFFEILTYFVIYSFWGWVLESTFRSIKEKKLINTGFLNGPFCPIYGAGAIIMYVLLENFKDNTILLFVVGFLVLSLWEYAVGAFLEKAFNTKYWDYSNHKINLQGRVCLTNSIYWGILGVIFIQYIHPFVQEKLALIDSVYLKVVIYSIGIIILIDAIISTVKIKNIKASLNKIEELNKQIKEKLEEIKELTKEKEKNTLEPNLQEVINKLNQKKNRILRRLYRTTYRLKKAFPAIETKEITEILNKKVELIKKDKIKKEKAQKDKAKNKKINKNKK